MKIPGYTIIRELGAGGMATVYLARQDDLAREVALKVMKPNAMAGDDFISRFVNEGQTIAQHQHPQIVTVYHSGCSDGYHYFSMEYLPGGTLAGEIEKGMSISRAISVTKKIAEALAVAHARGHIHRDVKPLNILFRADGTPVLTDFGIARALTRDAESMHHTSYGTVIGSPRYMSPEQSRGEPLDARSDLYSLGVVFHEMLTQRPPYEAEDADSLVMKHRHEPIPRLPHALSAYQPILDRLLAKKPEDRFASAGHLIRALEALESTTTAPATDDDATRIVPRGAGRGLTDSGVTGRGVTDAGMSGQRSEPARSGGRIVLALIAITLIAALGVYLGMPSPDDQSWREIVEQLPPEQPDRPETVVQYEALAIRHFLEAKMEASLGAIRLGLAITPDDARLTRLRSLIEQRAEADQRLAEALRLQGENRLDESLRLVREGLALDPQHAGLSALEDVLEQQIGAARQRLAEDALVRARAAREGKRLDEAMRLTEEGLEQVPDHPELLALQQALETDLEEARDLDERMRRIRDLIAAEKLEDALAAIERALTADPDHPELLDLRKLARKQLERRVERQIAAILEQAEANAESDNDQQALTLIAQGLALDPDHQGLKALRTRILAARDADLQAQAEARLSQALAAFEQGDLDGSLALVDQGLELLPGHAGLVELRVRILARSDQAKQIANRLRDCDTRFPLADIGLANGLDAHACYAGILTLDPANAAALAAIQGLGDAMAGLIPPLLEKYRLDDAEAALARLQKIRPDHARLAALQEDLQRRRDFLPVMVDIVGGCFRMGSPANEDGREQDERPHDACVDDFRLGRFEVTVREFARFVKATGYRTDAERGTGDMNGCEALDRNDEPNAWSVKTWANWRKPNTYQAARDEDPVSCLSWNDVDAYIAWLDKETSHAFRLPTEAEWEYAARAGSATSRFWGEAADENACGYCNSADKGKGWDDGFPCSDGHEWVAPVGGFQPNPWGLFDMLGNVWEWTCSEYDPDYRGTELLCAPGSVDSPRVLRGGAWNSGPALVRSAYRNRNFPESRYSFVGFRLAQDSLGKD